MIEDCRDIITKKKDAAYAFALEVKQKGLDPTMDVEISQAEDLAARVEGLVGPKGCAPEIRTLIKEKGRDKSCTAIMDSILDGKYGAQEPIKLAEQAVRTAVTLFTDGIVVAGTEGISKLEKNSNSDGSKYLSIYFASPIRSAGGTAGGFAAMLADYARKKIGLQEYQPTEKEIDRYVEEMTLYEQEFKLQYFPKEPELRAIIKNCPICVDGDQSSTTEVSINKNLERVKTNCLRGGMCLVLGESIAQKKAKMFKLSKNLGLGWDWFESMIEVSKSSGGTKEIKPIDKYLDDIVGGRPIFAYPSRAGAFRLRYGRARNTGINSRAIHPATMHMLDDFAAIATQLKIERPKKGCAVTPNDMIEPPVVLMKNGDVIRVENSAKSIALRPDVKEILFLGDMLVSYGDFLNANHPLVPSGICEDWWELLAKKEGINVNPYAVTMEQAIAYSKEKKIPLHPRYTYFYADLTKLELITLITWLKKAEIETIDSLEGKKVRKMKIQNSEEKRLLERLCIPHKLRDGFIIIEEPEVLEETLALRKEIDLSALEANTPLELINKIAEFPVYNKAPTYIGARMGRPEKAKERMMSPAPHGLFPVGNYGGKTRSLAKAAEKGKVMLDMPKLVCEKCGKGLMKYKCECGGRAVLKRVCIDCGTVTDDEKCPKCGGKTNSYFKSLVDLEGEVKRTLAELKEVMPDKTKGVIGLMNKDKYFEPLEKILIRAKYNVYSFKDGTARFDASNIPVTHIKPYEICVSVEKMKEMGYTHDYKGQPLERDDQILELWPQDVLLSDRGAEYFVRVCSFIDELLEKYYKMPRFYNVKTRDDLVGQLVIGMAPHISSGSLGRIVGFTKARGLYAHPFFHCACRRDCFHPDETFPLFDGSKWQIVKIGEFIEKMISENDYEVTDSQDVVVKSGKYSTLALDNDNNYAMRKITAFSKHSVQDHITRLKTSSGRTITTSGMHNFLTPEHEKVPAFALEETIVPAEFEIPEVDVAEIDLLKYADSETMVTGMNAALKKHLDKKGLKKTADKLGISNKTLFNYTIRDSIPVDVLNKLEIKIMKNVGMKTRHDTVTIPRFIKVDKNFLNLLGLYAAEGHTRKRAGSHYQVGLAVTKNKQQVKETIEKVFGISPYESDVSFAICSRVIYNLFEGLGCGKGAKQKRIPSFILGLPKEKVKWFLQGYFQGDGCVSKPTSRNSTIEVNCTSVNKMLLRDVEFCLTRFGVLSSWSTEKRSPTVGKVAEFYKRKGTKPVWTEYKLRCYGRNAAKYCQEIGFWFNDKNDRASEIIKTQKFMPTRTETSNQAAFNKITEREYLKSSEPLYNLTVEEDHNVIMSGITTKQCDGDEDSLTMLMDALLNFSRKYISAKAGGTEDIPLILSTVLNPMEIDDQAHDIEVMERFPLDFYDATQKLINPADFKIPIVKNFLASGKASSGLGFMFDTARIDEGPLISQYAQLKTMAEKVDRQLALAERIRAVDEKDVAMRVINFHFMRDIYGNLRSFGQQTFRCVECNEKFRRPPLVGKCTKCGGKIILTVHKGGIEKYLYVSQNMAEKYGLGDYLKQRLKLIETDLAFIFQAKEEKQKQFSLSDFM